MKQFILCLSIMLSGTLSGVAYKSHITDQLKEAESELKSLRAEAVQLEYSQRETLTQKVSQELDEIAKVLKDLRYSIIGPKVQDFDVSFGKQLTAALDEVEKIRKLNTQLSKTTKDEWQPMRLKLEAEFADLGKSINTVRYSYVQEYKP
jgi:biotin-(acetyl-CoA carboxylase) ligase